MRSDAIKPGDVIAGKYRVRAILSRQRGFLVEAFHTEIDLLRRHRRRRAPSKDQLPLLPGDEPGDADK